MSLLTADELRELRRLHLVAGRKVDALFAGDYRSAVRGQGMEFEEVRSYVPGDDVRRIDWNVTARSGEPFVKVYREERQNTVLLVVDVSGSTKPGSGGRDGRTTKRLQMARVAGGLAYAALRSQDRVGLITFSDQVEVRLPPRRPRHHVWGVIRQVYEASARSRRTDLATALREVGRLLRRRAVVVVVSDFLDAGDWKPALAGLARRHTTHAVLVHDPIEAGLPGLGLLEWEDAETGAVGLLDASSWSATQPLEERTTDLRRTGARTLAIGTQEDAFLALHRHFQRLGLR